MIHSRIEKNRPGEISVRLVLDMQQYSECCHKLHRNKKLGDDTQAQKQFAQQRLEAGNQFSGVSGEIYWLEVKKALRTLCDPSDPIELLLAQSMQTSEETPIAMQILDNHFIELLKNSMDAILTRYLNDQSENTTLAMQISISSSITNEQLEVTIRDNAGGFREDYIRHFSELVASQRSRTYTYKEGHRLESEKASGSIDKKYYFGGAGLAMNLICAEIHKCDQSSMRISNTSDGAGAKITLTSRMTPMMIEATRKSTTPDNALTVSPLCSATSIKSPTPTETPLASQSLFASRRAISAAAKKKPPKFPPGVDFSTIASTNI